MTKKDYELFAHNINKMKPVYDDTHSEMMTNIITLCAEVFKKDNPLFQPEKFERACYEGKHIRKTIKNL